MKRILIAALVIAALAAAYVFLMRRPSVSTEELTALWSRFQAATDSGDIAALKTVMSAARLPELDTESAAAQLQIAAALQPANPRVVGVDIQEDRATLKLAGDPNDGATVSGTAQLVRENGLWKIDKVSWEMSMDLTGQGPAIDIGPPEVVFSLSSEAAAVLDRMAGADLAAAVAAWNEIGGKYMGVAEFLEAFRPALYDARPIGFTIFEDSFTPAGGAPLRYFSAKAEAPPGEPLARTVGEALQRHLWRLDANGAGHADFATWWARFEQARRLKP
jgi:hypothetical protein